MVYMKRKEKGPGKSGRGQALFLDPLRPADLLGEWPNLTPPHDSPRESGVGVVVVGGQAPPPAGPECGLGLW